MGRLIAACFERLALRVQTLDLLESPGLSTLDTVPTAADCLLAVSTKSEKGAERVSVNNIWGLRFWRTTKEPIILLGLSGPIQPLDLLHCIATGMSEA